MLNEGNTLATAKQNYPKLYRANVSEAVGLPMHEKKPVFVSDEDRAPTLVYPVSLPTLLSACTLASFACFETACSSVSEFLPYLLREAILPWPPVYAIVVSFVHSAF